MSGRIDIKDSETGTSKTLEIVLRLAIWKRDGEWYASIDGKETSHPIEDFNRISQDAYETLAKQVVALAFEF